MTIGYTDADGKKYICEEVLSLDISIHGEGILLQGECRDETKRSRIQSFNRFVTDIKVKGV